METLNLSFLKDCPQGRELYSSLVGNCYFFSYNDGTYFQIRVKTDDTRLFDFNITGKYFDKLGECTLFPSKNCQDWSKWQEVLVHTGDYVLDHNNVVVYVKSIEGNTAEIIYPNGTIKSYDVHNIKGWTTKDYITAFNKVIVDNGYVINDGIIRVKIKFDPKSLQPFDKVLVRDFTKGLWKCDIFSSICEEENVIRRFHCIGTCWKQCIPYNEDTKHLVGTTDTPPEFYNIFKLC